MGLFGSQKQEPGETDDQHDTYHDELSKWALSA